jgi:astacin
MRTTPLLLLAAALMALPATAQNIPRTVIDGALGSGPQWPLGVAAEPFSTAVFQGKELSYEVIDGLAIHAGDIILGTAEEAAAADPRLLAAAPHQPGVAVTAIHEESPLWPGGVIPYVIDADLANRDDVLAAISEWNEKTVIRLVERKTEPNYVRFKSDDSSCRAHQGMIGGEQFVLLHETCSAPIVVHEIGHAVGLWHEHQRQDRDRYLMVYDVHVAECRSPFDLVPDAHVDRPYDFASVMHYGRGPFSDLPWLETVPPGLSIVSNNVPGPLSSGDIDYVARLYGLAPTATTISTNPPGLDIVVDGVRVTSPATFDWAPGSRHRLEAPVLQAGDDRTRYVFGRWTDDGARAHVITADPDTTWYQASFIVQHHIVPRALDEFHRLAEQLGDVTVNPRSPDDYYAVGTRVVLTAQPTSGNIFLRWSTRYSGLPGRFTWIPRSDFISWISGNAWNPAYLTVNVSRPDEGFGAMFTSAPVFTVDSVGYNHGGVFGYALNKWIRTTPFSERVSDFVDQFQDNDGHVRLTALDGLGSSAVGTLSRFNGWSDGVYGVRERKELWAEITREVDVPADGGKLTMEWTTYNHLLLSPLTSGGTIQLSPRPTDMLHEYSSHFNYYPKDTSVQLTAVPEAGQRFVAWTEGASGTDPVTTVLTDHPKVLRAIFSADPVLEDGRTEEVDLSTGTERGFWFNVPFGATSLAVDLMMEAGMDGTLSIRQGGQGVAHFREELLGGAAKLVITPESTPPLTAGPYHIAASGAAGARGEIGVAVSRGAPVKAFPRAFSFVSVGGLQPPAQSFELRNMADRQLSYRIASDQGWLTVHPAEVHLGAGRKTEITVQPRWLPGQPDTYSADLTITSDRWPDQGVDLPVTLAVADDPAVVGTCTPDSETLCLQGSRYEVRVDWWTGNGETGTAQVVPEGTNDSGLFRFFDPDNWEILIKVLDGCAVNGHVWVYGASTTDLGYSIRVTDTVSGEAEQYRNEAGRPAPAITDNEAFSGACDEGGSGATGSENGARSGSAGSVQAPLAQISGRSGSGCTGSDSSLCLADSRFEVTVDWSKVDGSRGPARTVPVGTNNSGLFYFFDQGNWEMLVKVLDGCAINDHHWVYAASATDQGLDITVTDTASGKTWSHSKAPGPPASAITESEAFPDSCQR